MARRSIPAGAFVLVAAMFAGMAGCQGLAQSSRLEGSGGVWPASAGERATSAGPAAEAQLPDAPRQSTAGPQSSGSIYGTVTDPAGNVIAGASVTLEAESNSSRQTVSTDRDGFYSFSGLAAGAFRLSVSAKGFAPTTAPEIVLSPGRYYGMPDIALHIAPTSTDVEVLLPREELAEVQINQQEQQRILGVLPNFYTSYIWRAVPLTTGQKFRLALRTSVDPVTFAVDAATAGVEQSTDAFSGYGQGGEGYAKRFGAAYADDVIDTMIGSAVLPSILHQDPRYFYKGTGTVSSRALYAISAVVICRGDNGRRQPNYSNIFGNLISAGISNAYYPASNRTGAGVTIDNALIGTAEGAVSALLQEFVFKKISRGVQHAPPAQP